MTEEQTTEEINTKHGQLIDDQSKSSSSNDDGDNNDDVYVKGNNDDGNDGNDDEDEDDDDEDEEDEDWKASDADEDFIAHYGEEATELVEGKKRAAVCDCAL